MEHDRSTSVVVRAPFLALGGWLGGVLGWLGWVQGWWTDIWPARFAGWHTPTILLIINFRGSFSLNLDPCNFGVLVRLRSTGPVWHARARRTRSFGLCQPAQVMPPLWHTLISSPILHFGKIAQGRKKWSCVCYSIYPYIHKDVNRFIISQSPSNLSSLFTCKIIVKSIRGKKIYLFYRGKSLSNKTKWGQEVNNHFPMTSRY